jgi:hypothetical protein
MKIEKLKMKNEKKEMEIKICLVESYNLTSTVNCLPEHSRKFVTCELY